jgi:hypothetical protein
MPEGKTFNDYLLGPQVGDYPKALYRNVFPGLKGDVKSPGYEKIVTNDSGIASRQVEYHVYLTTTATSPEQEKKLLKDGWVDSPSKVNVEVT